MVNDWKHSVRWQGALFANLGGGEDIFVLGVEPDKREDW